MINAGVRLRVVGQALARPDGRVRRHRHHLRPLLGVHPRHLRPLQGDLKGLLELQSFLEHFVVNPVSRTLDRGSCVLHLSRPQLCRDAVDTRVAELAGQQVEELRGEGSPEVAPEGRLELDHRGKEISQYGW